MRVMLPDGSVKEVAQGVTGAEVAMGIGAGLAKASVAIKVNGVQRDLTDSITEDANVALLTLNDEEGLDVMRHTIAAQVLARAVKNLIPKPNSPSDRPSKTAFTTTSLSLRLSRLLT